MWASSFAPRPWCAIKGKLMMASAAPAEEPVELFNKLIGISPADEAGLARIMWRLQALRRKLPGDLPVGVALLQCLSLQGLAGEAVDLAKELWPRRGSMETMVAVTYSALLTHLAMYEELLSFIGAHRDVRLDPVEMFSAIHAAWGSGNHGALLDALRHDSVGRQRPWRALLGSTNFLGILPYFKQRQEIVRKHVFRRQCSTHLIFTAGEERDIELTHYIAIAAPHNERAALVDAIYDDLYALHRSVGLGGIDFWSCAPIVIVDQRERPSIRQELAFEEFASEAL